MIEKPGEAPPSRIRNNPARSPRKAFVIPFLISSVVFFIVSLPAGLMGQEVTIQDLLLRLKTVERELVRMVGLAEYKIPAKVPLCGHDVPIDRQEVREALEQEFYQSLGNRGIVMMWVKRSGRYFPYIEKRLKERGMPDDLKYLAVAESDLKPYAYSPAGASGIWQFVEGTGRHFGLRVDSRVDERRDFLLSTEAALDFLTRLNSQFNDWLLAMASYNAGPGRIADEMDSQKVKSYFDLNLPRETERYIFRIAAIKIIMMNPEQFGIDLTPEEKFPAYDLETVTVTVPVKSISLNDVAQMAGTTYKNLTEINLHIRTPALYRGSYSIHLPKGSLKTFSAAWDEKFKTEVESQKAPPAPPASPAPASAKPKKVFYTVKKGDTLAGIARKYNCSIDDIRKWNKMKKNTALEAGKRLTIYR